MPEQESPPGQPPLPSVDSGVGTVTTGAGGVTVSTGSPATETRVRGDGVADGLLEPSRTEGGTLLGRTVRLGLSRSESARAHPTTRASQAALGMCDGDGIRGNGQVPPGSTMGVVDEPMIG